MEEFRTWIDAHRRELTILSYSLFAGAAWVLKQRYCRHPWFVHFKTVQSFPAYFPGFSGIATAIENGERGIPIIRVCHRTPFQRIFGLPLRRRYFLRVTLFDVQLNHILKPKDDRSGQHSHITDLKDFVEEQLLNKTVYFKPYGLVDNSCLSGKLTYRKGFRRLDMSEELLKQGLANVSTLIEWLLTLTCDGCCFVDASF
eukprot:GHVQ01030506.1.p1 GENE.GHVQ01030506.1~~GHVQ01030506.1.p1  ORF type:complete len:200 (+),score=8.68 GHVQ01030506.1:102-701(+)